MPRDGGHLIINSREELDEVEKDPTAAKYIRRFIMGNEVINNIQRWCLWMVDLDPVDISRSEILKKRFSAVAESRLASSAESTRKMAQTPHLFGQRAQPTSAYVGIPKVFSENRKFATCDRFLPDVIAGDKVYTALDPDGFVFGVISSSMFITWQKLVGGRLESRPSFSNTIVWNNFPLPSTPPTLREAIVAAGENVQQVRAKFPTSSLADLYNPLAMDPSLLKAHAELDAVVDKAFGAQKRLHSSEEREQLLFEAFLRLSESEEEEGATRP
jgi:hypothetical protein